MAEPREVAPLTAIRLVAQRELNTRLRTKSFVIGTVVIIAVIAGYLLLQASIFGDRERTDIGLSGQASNLAGPLKTAGEALDLDVRTTAVRDEEQARAQLTDDELDAVVSGNPAELRVLVRSELDPKLRAMLTGIAQQQVLAGELAKAGVRNPGEVLAAADEAATVQVTTLERGGEEQEQRLGIGLIMAFLLFMAISSYGALVAQGVVEEKSSRVVEILLATVRPWQLLLGKVVGLGLVGLAQMLIIAVAGLIMATAADVITLSGIALSTIAWGVLWYVLGFFLYATIFAAAGSLVSRQEDAQSVLAPVTMVLTIGFVVGLNLMIQNPDSTASAALSLVPLLSPILMPGRIIAGDVGALEIVLAIVLTLAAIALITWLGGRVYRNAVLRTGSRMKLTEALRG